MSESRGQGRGGNVVQREERWFGNLGGGPQGHPTDSLCDREQSCPLPNLSFIFLEAWTLRLPQLCCSGSPAPMGRERPSEGRARCAPGAPLSSRLLGLQVLGSAPQESGSSRKGPRWEVGKLFPSSLHNPGQGPSRLRVPVCK